MGKNVSNLLSVTVTMDSFLWKSEWACECAFPCHAWSQAVPRSHYWDRLPFTWGPHSYHGKEPGCSPFSRLENLSSFPSVLSLPSHGYLLSSLLKDASKLFSEFKDRVKIGGASAQSFKCPEARDHRRAGYLIRIGEGKTLQQNTNYYLINCLAILLMKKNEWHQLVIN